MCMPPRLGRHTRHRKAGNFVINALAAYSIKPTKPSIGFNVLENEALVPS